MGKAGGRLFAIALTVTWALAPMTATARAANLHPASGLIGSVQKYRVRAHESLVEVARKFDLGFNAIVDANPGVDPFVPPADTLIDIPTAWILPNVSMGNNVVINLPEFRLYYHPAHGATLFTFPLGIGDEGRDTPVGTYTVIEKIVAPVWHVPKSIRSESSSLPREVPPGPNNPLGSHALRLSLETVLIHGTNRPWGIGRRSSHGCIRLYPEDIVQLFRLVPHGTPVVIVKQPVKIAARGQEVFLEAHRYESKYPTVSDALHMLADRHLLGKVDFAKLIRAMQEVRGVPVNITVESLSR